MSFENQNKRVKLRIELENGMLIEVPLAVVVRSIQVQFMEPDSKSKVGFAFQNFFCDRSPLSTVTLEVRTCVNLETVMQENIDETS